MPEVKNKTITKTCTKHGEALFSVNSDGKARCRKCTVDAVDKRRRVLKLKAIEYKGGKCQGEGCGYFKCPDALEFHHLDPKEKDFSISNTGVTRSWDKIKIELDKCLLLCANCHREAHFNLRSKAVISLEDIKPRRVQVNCQSCNKEYSVMASEKESRKFCSQECSKISQRKVTQRPSKEELKKLLWEVSTAQIAKTYGVADHTIAKWAKAYDLDKPPRGYWAKQKSTSQSLSNSV